MEKSKLPAIVGGLIVVWIVMFIVNFLILKATVKWPEQPADSTVAQGPGESDELNLTWDISGESGPPRDRWKDIQEQQQKDAKAMVDSVVTQATTPIVEEVKQTQEELTQAQEQVDDLQNLLASLTASADSLDQLKAKQLSKLLEGMKPQNAASILTQLNTRVNAEILLTMRQKQASKILAEMPRERAAEVARFLSRAYARSTSI